MMATAQQADPEIRKTVEELKPVSEQIRAMLGDGQAELALSLSLSELERSKHELAKMREVMIDHDGRMIAHSLQAAEQIGNMLARGFAMVPDRFRGKPEDCALVHLFCQRLGIDTVSSMSSIYVVHGRVAIEGKLAIAILNTSADIDGRVKFELSCKACNKDVKKSNVCPKCKTDDNLQCTASAKDAKSGEVLSFPVDMDMVRGEGWDKDAVKNGTTYPSKWNTMRVLMFHYRSGQFLARTHFPEILMGVTTLEEMQDVDPTVMQVGEIAASSGSGTPDALAGLTPTVQTESRPATEPEQTADSGDGGGTGQEGTNQPEGANPSSPPVEETTESDTDEFESPKTCAMSDEYQREPSKSLGENSNGPPSTLLEESELSEEDKVYQLVKDRLQHASPAGQKRIMDKAREGKYGPLGESHLTRLEARLSAE